MNKVKINYKKTVDARKFDDVINNLRFSETSRKILDEATFTVYIN